MDGPIIQKEITVPFVFPFLLNLFLFFPDLLPENCVEEKTKSFDPNGIMAEINHRDRPGVHLKWVFQTKREVSVSFCDHFPLLDFFFFFKVFSCITSGTGQIP